MTLEVEYKPLILLPGDQSSLCDIDFVHVNRKEKSIHQQIVLVEITSIFLALVCFILTAYLAYEDRSVAASAISVDCFLDILAFSVCIWRYQSADSGKSIKWKDMIASVTLSCIFIITTIWIEYLSVNSYLNSDRPKASVFFIAIAVWQAILFMIIALIKFALAKRIEHNSVIISDGINSVVCAMSNLSMAVSMTLYIINPNIWYLDSLFGFFIGLFTLAYGVQLMLPHVCSRKNIKH